jgi:hypothetical protein
LGEDISHLSVGNLIVQPKPISTILDTFGRGHTVAGTVLYRWFGVPRIVEMAWIRGIRFMRRP